MDINGFGADLKNESQPENDKEKTQVRKRLLFFGRVQGVGFRYRLIRAAKSLGLVGWVKNKADLSVEAEAQGEEKKIRLLVKYMRSVSGPTVTKVQSRRLPTVEGEKDFILRW
ncbi:MAG: acylphosphatase [Firmicutes bacterium]|nr:acylphosphatase [Bacillota bacterium]